MYLVFQQRAGKNVKRFSEGEGKMSPMKILFVNEPETEPGHKCKSP